MATSSLLHTSRPTPTTWSTWLIAALAEAAHEWRLARDLRQVESLDGRLLQDIGLGRGGIEDAVRHGRRARPYADLALRTGPVASRPLPASWTEWR